MRRLAYVTLCYLDNAFYKLYINNQPAHFFYVTLFRVHIIQFSVTSIIAPNNQQPQIQRSIFFVSYYHRLGVVAIISI